MSKDIGPLIDLYEKFLIAFVGIVTPALTLYLNNYLIPKSKFTKWKAEQEKDLKNRTQFQEEFEKVATTKEDLEFAAQSNEELRKDKEKFEKWEKIVEELDPKAFFIANVRLLALSMLFLFLWLFIRTEKYMSYDQCFFPFAQIITSVLSIGCCLIHLNRLYEIGNYLIDVRLDVEEINQEIDKEIQQEEKRMDKRAGKQKNAAQLELNFEENNQE